MAADAFPVDILGEGHHFLGLAESAFEQQPVVYNPEGNRLCHGFLFINEALDAHLAICCRMGLVPGSGVIQSLLINRN